jgi:integrase
VNEDGAEEERKWAPLSWWTRKDLLYILSGVFERAIEWKLWDGRNPCDGVKLGPKKTKRVKRIPTKQDLDSFLAAIPETRIITAEGARYIVLTAVIVGLRISEVLGLRLGDIDGGERNLRVERRWRRGDEADPKSEASRRKREIVSFAEEILRYAKARGTKPDDYIFRRKDGDPLDDRDLQQHVFRPAAEAVGIYHEGFGMHVFRALNVTWRQTIGGAAPVEAQKAAGHASLDMTMLYTQTDGDREREQVGKILEHLGRVENDETLAEMKTEGSVQ